jgi:hypothetical protein
VNIWEIPRGIGIFRKGVFMKFLRNSFLLALALLLLLTGCVSSPNMERIYVTSGVPSQILNLRDSGKGNTTTTIGNRVMKDGFLGAGEEYGYYTLDMTSRYTGGNLGFWGVFGSMLITVPFFFGVPTDYDDYYLTVKLDIIDSGMNLIRSYSDSTTIRQWGGFYYGDSTDKASSAFTSLVRNIQRRAAADSAYINTALRASGPIGGRRGEQVVSLPSGQQRQDDIEGALNNAAKVIMAYLQERNLSNQRIAIVNISSTNREQSTFVAEELEVILDRNRFTIVDRSELDRIRREQNFQLSGEVDDTQIVSIGKFAGVGLVITGSITGSGSTRRLRLRVLDTQTAELKASASEPF